MKQLIFLFTCLAFFSATAQQKNPLPAPFPADTTWKAKVAKTDAEWKKILTPDQFKIAREEGTEAPFTAHNFNDHHEKGMYYCLSCHNPLFSSEQKFDSGTGWPSFWQTYSTKSVNKSVDTSFGTVRDEISCLRCGAHLGHVFDDGPKPTNLRYCMNGLVLLFKKDAPKN